MSDLSHRERGAWVLAGLSPAGQFLLERWSLRRDFPFVAVYDADQSSSHRSGGLPSITDWQRLLGNAEINGVVLTIPLERRAAAIRELLVAGKDVLVEGSPCSTLAECHELERLLSGRRLGVFHLRRADPDDLAAQSVVAAGRLGTLRSLRWIACEYTLPAGQPSLNGPLNETFVHVGPWLIDQISQLTATQPCLLQAWSMPATAGLQIRLEYSTGLTAWLEVHGAALCGWRTGWIIEGSRGAYRKQKLMTLAEDGELLEEDVRCASNGDDDVIAELGRLARDPSAARLNCTRAFTTRSILAAIERSVQLRSPVPLPERGEDPADAIVRPTGTAT